VLIFKLPREYIYRG